MTDFATSRQGCFVFYVALVLVIKKTLIASERQRSDVSRKRRGWINARQPIMRQMAHRLVFIDETSTNTTFTRLQGRALKGERLPGAAPHGGLDQPDVHCRSEVFGLDGTMDHSRCYGPQCL